jgi:hypothetical protein
MELELFVNETEGAVATLSCVGADSSDTIRQPPAEKLHRPGHMSFNRVKMTLLTASLTGSVLACSVLGWTFSASAQNAPAEGSASVSSTLRPALAQVSQTLGSLSIKKWKAPNEVRSAADQDVGSIQRDLNGTLAGLLQQADAAPGSVPQAFAAYRNVDALYDTLLRVVLTANLAAPDNEVSALQSALSSLEGARASLGESILNSSQAQQTELVRIRTALSKAAAAPAPPAKTTVVDDGPADSKTKKHTSTKKPASTPAKPASSPNSTPGPQ